MQTKIPTSFSIVSKYYDETGTLYDELRSRADGCLEIKGEETRILYKEKSEGALMITEMSFTQRDRITLKKSGAARYGCVFAVGEKSSFVYYAPPLSFDAEIVTKEIKNTMCLVGGCIEIKYGMDMGGYKQTVSIRIDAEARKK